MTKQNKANEALNLLLYSNQLQEAWNDLRGSPYTCDGSILGYARTHIECLLDIQRELKALTLSGERICGRLDQKRQAIHHYENCIETLAQYQRIFSKQLTQLKEEK